MRRFIQIFVLCLLPLSIWAAQELPLKSPQVLVIGKNGWSTNLEPATSAVTNAVEQPVSTNSVAPLNEDLVVEAEAEAPVIEETQPVPPRVPAPVQPVIDWDPLVSAMEMMIEQQKMSMVAMEKTRAESTLAARENSAAMQEKMESMEQALSDQREHEAESMARMNRLVIGVAGGFAGTGFIVMIFTAWFFMRTMNKVSEINANLHSQLLALPQIQHAQLGEGSGGGANPASQRLIGALEQLEKRIRDLEHTSDEDPVIQESESVEAEIIPPSTGTDTAKKKTNEVESAETASNEDSPSVATLLAKGQTLMNLDQPESALGCFNEALKKEPRSAEALLKKGTALERMRRMQDAIDAYDGAIAVDDSMTMAYLAKGGLCNRMERYGDALECYEKALQSQQAAA